MCNGTVLTLFFLLVELRSIQHEGSIAEQTNSDSDISGNSELGWGGFGVSEANGNVRGDLIWQSILAPP